MDMSRYLMRWLNDRELARMDGQRYEGVIDVVLEKKINNKFAGVKEMQPVIKFLDGWHLIPNVTMRLALIEFWGRETDEWEGRRLVVFRHRVDRTNKDTGEKVSRYEKRVMLPSTEAV
jgi:hypothetical protein